MYHRDYIIRMIQQFIVFIAELAGLKKKDDPEVILMRLEGAYQQFTGMKSEVVRSLSAEGIVSLFSATGEVDYNRILVTAILLREEAAALRSIRDPASESLSRKADRLISHIKGNEAKLYDELKSWMMENG